MKTTMICQQPATPHDRRVATRHAVLGFLSAGAALLALAPTPAGAQVGSTGLVYVDADLGMINGNNNLASSENLPLANTFDGVFSSPNPDVDLWEIRGVDDPVDPVAFPSDNLGSRPAGSDLTASQSIFTSGDRAMINVPDMDDVGDEAPELVQTIRLSDGIVAGTSYDIYAVYWSPLSQDWGLRAGLTSDPGANPIFNRSGAPIAGLPTTAGTLSSSAIWEAPPGPNNDEGLFTEGNRSQYLARVGTATPVGGEIEVFIDDLSTETLGLSNANRTFFDGVAFVESGIEVALTASVNVGTGVISLTNSSDFNIQFTGYALQSFTTSSLTPQGLTPIAGRLDGAGNSSIDDDLWTIDLPVDLAANSVNQIAESEDSGTDGGTLAPGETLFFGEAYLRSGFDSIFAPGALLNIELTLDDGSELVIAPEFVGTPLEPGDLDRDGDIDEDDFEVLAGNLFTDVAGLTPAERITLGDLGSTPAGGGLDGAIDFNDFRIFGDLFDAANGPGSFAALTSSAQAVPEPSAVGLLALAGLLAQVGGRRRRGQSASAIKNNSEENSPEKHRMTIRPFLLMTLAAVAAGVPAASAQVTLIDHSADPLFDPTDVAAGEVVAAAFLHDTTSANAPDANESDFTISRVSLDEGDFYGQSFTVSNGGGTLQSIFFAYNELQDFGSIQLRVDVGNDNVANGANNPLGPEDFVSDPIPLGSGTLSTDGGAGGPVFYMEFDLSAENIVLGNGEHNFSILGGPVTQTNGSFFFAPLRTGDGVPDPAFDGGNTVGFNVSNGSGLGGDHFFAVVVEDIDFPSLDLIVDSSDGTASLINNTGADLELDFYQIESGAGALDTTRWVSLADAGEAGWLEAGGSDDEILGEANLTAPLTLADGESRTIGAPFDPSITDNSPTLSYGVAGGDDELLLGDVLFVADDGVDPPTGAPGDFNDDGFVNAADYTAARDAIGPGVTLPNDPTPGVVDASDIGVFAANFDGGSSSGNAAVSATTVPEPAAAAMALLAGLLPAFGRRR